MTPAAASEGSARATSPPPAASRPPLPPAVRARGLARFLRATQGRAFPRIIGSYREPMWMFYEVLLPFLGTVAFVFVYRALGAPSRFIGYAVMGGAAVAIWSNIVWMMASQLWWEKKDGNLDLYMTAPCGLGPILMGMSVGGFIMASVRAVAVLITGALLFDVRFSISNYWMFFAVFWLTVIALYGLGMMLASLFLMWGRSAFHTSNLLMEPVFFVSGFYFPVRALGQWTGLAASIIPLTLGLDGLRQLLYPKIHPRLLPVGLEIGLLVVLAISCAFAARFALRKMEWMARGAGTLTERS